MTDVTPQPRTRRGKVLLEELPGLIRGPWTPFREEQWTLTILAIEAEAAALDVDALRAAPAAGGLDVRLLAEAMHNEQAARDNGCGSPGEAYDDHMEWHRYRAERIVPEYARLSETAPEPSE